MDTSTLLRKTVAEFFEVDEGQVGASFSLQARQGSIARAALDAAIRSRVGLTSTAIYSAKTFGELETELIPGSTPSVASAPMPTIASTSSSVPAPLSVASGASCGIDLELIANLPDVDDPWEDDFYRTHFTPSEIAYCVRQREPLTHFAARWCAKEALKKCDRAFLAVDLKAIEVVLDESGAPHLESLGDGLGSRRLPHAVSLSHTLHAAVAMVVLIRLPPTPAPTPLPMPPSTVATLADSVIAPTRRRGSLVLVVLNLIAVGLASLALARTFPGFHWPFSG